MLHGGEVGEPPEGAAVIGDSLYSNTTAVRQVQTENASTTRLPQGTQKRHRTRLPADHQHRVTGGVVGVPTHWAGQRPGSLSGNIPVPRGILCLGRRRVAKPPQAPKGLMLSIVRRQNLFSAALRRRRKDPYGSIA
jgi:hypothetical protein